MFLTLLRKDWRLAKPAFFLMCALYLAPIVLGIAITLYSRFFEATAPLLRYSSDDHSELVDLMWAGFFFCMFAAPAVAATQFGRERRERSSDFLGSLPVRRGTIVSSKALITAFLLCLPIVLSLLAKLSLLLAYPGATSHAYNESFMVVVGAALCLGACGLAFLFSCLLASEVLSTAVAVVIGIACALTIYLIFLSVPSFRTMPEVARMLAMNWTLIILFTFLAVGGFLSGTLIALYRRAL
jgi:ABC-type transport system involved in multi-copper enzyme maturation permease subunit